MTQVRPTTDLFTQGTPKFDTTRLSEYVRAAPSSTDGAYGSFGTGFAITAWSYVSTPYSGWFGQATSGGGPIDVGQSASPAVASSHSSSGTRIPTLFLPRSFVDLADVDVELSYQEQSTNSANLHSSSGARRTICGIAARVTGGTLTTGGTSTTHLVGGDGYFFGWCFDNALAVGGGKYVLFRVNAGVVKRLADDPTGATTSDSWMTSQPWKQRVLRMTIHDSGGATIIKCYRRRTGALPIGEADLLFTVVDTGVGRLSAAGRVGFFTSNEEKVGSIWSAPCVNYFAARAYGAGPYDLRDEWQRYYLPAAELYAAGTDHAFSGYDLSSGWFGDSLSSVVPSSIVEDDGNDRARITAGHLGTYARQLPAADPITQDREVTVRFASSGTPSGARSCGPALRVSGTGLAASSSYDFVLEYTDGGSSARYVLSRTSAGIRKELAVLAATYTTDANIVLALSVEASSSGAAVLRAYDGGVQVVLVDPALPVHGVTVSTAGTVVDASSARVTSGTGQGFYAVVPGASSQALYVDAFDEASLVTVELADDDMAAASYPGEADAATGTLDLPLAWPIEEVSNVSAVRHELDLGNRYTALADSTIARAWSVSVPAGPDAEQQALEQFLADHRGPEVPFSWTPPGDLAATVVRFRNVQREVRTVNLGPTAWVSSFELEELVPAP